MAGNVVRAGNLLRAHNNPLEIHRVSVRLFVCDFLQGDDVHCDVVLTEQTIGRCSQEKARRPGT
eukprot:3048922-Pyramimonas_sp.AAC.1